MSKPLDIIERTTWVLAVAMTCVSGLIWGKAGWLATGVGGALMVANLWSIRRLGSRAVALVVAGSAPRAVGLAAMLFLKMLALFALVWVAIRVYNLALLPFALGISVLPISLVTAGLWTGVAADQESKV